MKVTWKNAALAAISSGLIGYGLLLVFSTILWRFYPYPVDGNEAQIMRVWVNNTLWEKLFSNVVVAVCAVGSALPVRSKWKYGFAAAIGSGIVIQAVLITTHVIRFGFAAYLDNHRFWATMGTTVAISAFFGLMTVWRSYRRENEPRTATVPDNCRPPRV